MRPEPSELQELVRDLHRQRSAWLPAGLGSRLDWGPPVQEPCTVVSCAALRGVREFNPGDFTITVAAGTPLVEVQEALGHQGQWLSVDAPWGDGEGGAAGSIGGLVARGLAGGYRQRYLGVRDQLIGIALMRADGVTARAGGKVVKNVAGYDLMRLFTGSWGSLGLITELTLRTLPQPPLRRSVCFQGGAAELAGLSRWLLGSSLSPERIDWWNSNLAAAAGLPPEPLLLIGLATLALVPTVPALWAASVFVGIGMAFNYPSLLALTVNRASDSDRAWAISSFTMFFEVGSVVGGLFIGGFAQVVGKQTGFLGGVIACLVGLYLLRFRLLPAAASAARP